MIYWLDVPAVEEMGHHLVVDWYAHPTEFMYDESMMTGGVMGDDS